VLTAAKLGLHGSIGQRATSAASVVRCRSRLDDRARRERRAILLCVLTGLLMQGVVLGIGFVAGKLLAHLSHRPDYPIVLICMGFAAVMCAFTLLIAALTKPAGRAEQARQMLRQTFHSAAHNHSPDLGVVTSVMILIALYGSYAIVEASKRAFMRLRLSRVDRDEAARLLAKILAVPTGVATDTLLKAGQSPELLRGSIALLILDGWIEVTDHGKWLIQRSPARRQLLYRHPLAEVFQLAEVN
jgi:hypothetical protein